MTGVEPDERGHRLEHVARAEGAGRGQEAASGVGAVGDPPVGVLGEPLAQREAGARPVERDHHVAGRIPMPSAAAACETRSRRATSTPSRSPAGSIGPSTSGRQRPQSTASSMTRNTSAPPPVLARRPVAGGRRVAAVGHEPPHHPVREVVVREQHLAQLRRTARARSGAGARASPPRGWRRARRRMPRPTAAGPPKSRTSQSASICRSSSAPTSAGRRTRPSVSSEHHAVGLRGDRDRVHAQRAAGVLAGVDDRLPPHPRVVVAPPGRAPSCGACPATSSLPSSASRTSTLVDSADISTPSTNAISSPRLAPGTTYRAAMTTPAEPEEAPAVPTPPAVPPLRRRLRSRPRIVWHRLAPRPRPTTCSRTRGSTCS